MTCGARMSDGRSADGRTARAPILRGREGVNLREPERGTESHRAHRKGPPRVIRQLGPMVRGMHTQNGMAVETATRDVADPNR